MHCIKPTNVSDMLLIYGQNVISVSVIGSRVAYTFDRVFVSYGSSGSDSKSPSLTDVFGVITLQNGWSREAKLRFSDFSTAEMGLF